MVGAGGQMHPWEAKVQPILLFFCLHLFCTFRPFEDWGGQEYTGSQYRLWSTCCPELGLQKASPVFTSDILGLKMAREATYVASPAFVGLLRKPEGLKLSSSFRQKLEVIFLGIFGGLRRSTVG